MPRQRLQPPAVTHGRVALHSTWPRWVWFLHRGGNQYDTSLSTASDVVEILGADLAFHTESCGMWRSVAGPTEPAALPDSAELVLAVLAASITILMPDWLSHVDHWAASPQCRRCPVVSARAASMTLPRTVSGSGPRGRLPSTAFRILGFGGRGDRIGRFRKVVCDQQVRRDKRDVQQLGRGPLGILGTPIVALCGGDVGVADELKFGGHLYLQRPCCQ